MVASNSPVSQSRLAKPFRSDADILSFGWPPNASCPSKRWQLAQFFAKNANGVPQFSSAWLDQAKKEGSGAAFTLVLPPAA